MNKIYISMLVMLVCLPIFAQVNGQLSMIENHKVLHVWGSHYQRGYAQGYLLADEIMEVFEDYFYTMQVFSDADYYSDLWDFLMNNYVINPRYLSECDGIIDGMTASGNPPYFAQFQRNLEAEDIYLLNASIDLAFWSNLANLQLGCASLASWDISTQNDLVLAGKAVITRFLDWSPNSALIAHPLMTIHHPSETDEQKWLSMGFPGFIGAISAINQSQVSAFVNTGNDHFYTDLNDLSPILFSVREGIESADVNGDDTYNADDLYTCISQKNHLAGFIIQNLSQSGDYLHSSVIESNNSGTVRRLYNQNGNLPGRHIAATNHFRSLSYPTCCTRYVNIQDSLYTNSQVTAKRQWNVLAGAAGMENNLQAMQYIPEINYLLWTSATLEEPAYIRPGITFDTALLFSTSLSIDDDPSYNPAPRLKIYPQPSSELRNIKIESSNTLRELVIFNLRGQAVLTLDTYSKEIDLSTQSSIPDLSSGVYFIRVKDIDSKYHNQRILILN